MSGKHMYTSGSRDRNEKKERQKQIGCMNGFFQLFDRHHFLAGRGSTTGGAHNLKKLLPSVPGQNANHGNECSRAAADKTPVQKKFLKEVVKEKQNAPPTESSRTSFSSSCSSTFSSVECNKKAHQEPPSSCQSIFPETPSPNFPMKQTNSSLHLGRKSPDLRELGKDSMYREARGLLVKTVAKEEGKGRAMKHIDSPRPSLQSKPSQPRVNSDGSTRVFARLGEATWSSKEEKDGSLPLGPKDTPRFSYDGRASQYSLKYTVQHKELPRLSLDSRGSIRSSAAESRSNYLSTVIKRENENSSQILHPESGSNKRPSGVVARLMGLEAFPDSNSPAEDFNAVPRLGDESMQNQVSKSPRVTHKDPAPPRLRNANSVMKPTSNSRFPREPAPWGSQKPASRSTENRTKIPHATPSVYGEIDKRLTELEFKKSGKDLRTLEQILEAMQKTRKRLENETEEQSSNVESQTSKYSPKYSSFHQVSRLATQQSQQSNDAFSPTIKGTSPPRRDGSPILIRKLATDLTPSSSHLRNPSRQPHDSMDKKTKAKTLRASPSSKAPQHMEENPTSFRRISGTVSPRRTVSPRLQHTKSGTEKQCLPTTPPSDLRRARRQPRKQPIESGSPTRKLKPKSTNLQQGDDQSSGLSGESRNMSHHSETVSVQSESNISFESQFDTEVTSTYSSKDPTDKNFEARLTEDKSIAELTTATLEQPSPVSVLDATFYGEGSPSPVKKISNAFEDDEAVHYDEAKWETMDMDHLVNSTGPSHSSKFNKHLVHKLRLANSSGDEASIDHIASFCDTSPDHRYITEILLASGFLEDQGFCSSTIQLHPAGHFINPNLFQVLEKTKGNTDFANDEHHKDIAHSKSNEKIRRKLVFDAVNEILGRKLALAGSSELPIFSKKLERRGSSGQKLLKELWSELDNLQSKADCIVDDEDDGLTSILSADMMHQSNDWTYYPGEFSGLVLYIERMIFKDLICEVVNGGAADLQDRPRSHCRQLFSK